MSRLPDAELSQAERAAAVARRRYLRALSTADGRRHPAARLPEIADVADVPDPGDLEERLPNRIDEEILRLEISCFIQALKDTAKTDADWRNLCQYANDLAFDEPITNRKWVQRWRAKNRALLDELRAAWRLLMSA
jgi:hypothetical protein